MDDITPATTNCLECEVRTGPEAAALVTEYAVLCGRCAEPLIRAEAAHLRALAVLDDPSTVEASRIAAERVVARYDLDVGAQLWICGTEYGSEERREAESALKAAAMLVIREER